MEKNELDERLQKGVQWIITDKIWTWKHFGDVNISGQNKMHSKTQISNSVLLMYKNGS